MLISRIVLAQVNDKINSRKEQLTINLGLLIDDNQH